MKKLFVITLGISVFISACAPQRISLNKEEKKLQKELQTELNCPDLEFRNDYEAITEKRDNGSFAVSLCDPFCTLDSTELKKIALKVAPKIIKILNYKANYKEIWFYTTIEKHTSERSSTLTCSKIVRILLDNPNNAFFEDHTNYP